MANTKNTATTKSNLFVLTFHLAEQTYALPITQVLQIIDMVAISNLAQAPHYVVGMINVRGQIVPLLDMRLRFGLPFKAYTLHTPIILIKWEERVIGLVVDVVDEVVEISAAQLTQGDKILPDVLLDDPEKSKDMTYLENVAMFGHQLVPVLRVSAILRGRDKDLLTAALKLQTNGETAA